MIYNTCIKELIEKALEGFDTSIFVYGQSGTGKTYTIIGEDKQKPNLGIVF